MKYAVISSPSEFPDEIEIIDSLFKEGLEIFHLRKPDYNLSQFEELIEKIYEKYHRKIVIHSNYELIEKYNLKGIHFSLKNINIKNLKINPARKYSISASFHSLDEFYKYGNKFDYAFISPVFNSISKKDYKSEITHDEINKFLKSEKKQCRVFALGGIDENNVEIIKELGFDGFATLGAIWNKSFPKEEIVNKFRRIWKIVNC
ncbi:MAG: thiamine phosphate synthase [Bacteroidales bacterium]|nr:thiamine phosphate synthase [Bacteroidales bacterium]